MTVTEAIKEVLIFAILIIGFWGCAMLLIDDIRHRLKYRRMRIYFENYLTPTPSSTGEPRPLTIAEGRELIGYDIAADPQHANLGNGAVDEIRS